MAITSTPIETNRFEAKESFAHRRAPWLWGSLVIALLGGQVALGVFTVVLATGDPSFAVVPDYHEKAMHWDDATLKQAASDHLGWTASTQFSAAADALGQRTLVVTLTDQLNQPIKDATLRVRVFHHARAGDPVQMPLRSHADGHYTAAIAMQRDGLWQIELSGSRGNDERFELSKTIDTQAAATDKGNQ